MLHRHDPSDRPRAAISRPRWRPPPIIAPDRARARKLPFATTLALLLGGASTCGESLQLCTDNTTCKSSSLCPSDGEPPDEGDECPGSYDECFYCEAGNRRDAIRYSCYGNQWWETYEKDCR